MYDRILVPTDGSPSMQSVVDHATELAAVHDATLHGLYVVDTGSFATLPVETTWDGVTEMLREEGELALSEFTERAGDAPVETAIMNGNPSSEIVEYAREHDCDTIVMGTHGRGGIDRLLLGSVAERVVRAAPIPVVTVPISEGETDVEAARS
ncbi:universal stress protein [Haloarcula salinisoli]|uniref:Universal stress protein n=1 Tax=Haloarcula salinisoli TaxID=2487746 RepID=A0A8J8CCI5_9EURY|nr:universal stress protein [Halomicroarcula salinisoli]MBX0285002.1 universal stress protein [Halomicroarcula salinisoli]MBX0303520.1 universal stress protein [Halomicroarcula salinisoli]